MTLEFEWDHNKSESNLQKHGVSFEEAQTIFSDPDSQTYFDSIHSQDEPRYIDIGISSRGRLLIVVYTERNSKIRIISSRLCTPKEAQRYETN
ncbi:MAG: BrnT family toxin [Snowella sp.]|nr:BrnT family toxin [Snowella sp.]